MRKLIRRPFKLALLSMAWAALAFPDTVNIGYVVFSVTNSPLAEVDIVNLTGPNSLPSEFPVLTSVNLLRPFLTVNFKSGPAETFVYESGYFTLDPDGLSFKGEDIFNTVTDPVTSVTLIGTYFPVSVTIGNTSVGLFRPFSATITDPTGTLVDGDSALLTAGTFGSTPPTVPEPKSYLLLSMGLATWLFRFLRRGVRV